MPQAAGSSPTRPTVIFLNAGVIHRVGPHRLHVNLARALASRGIASVRLDLSGIGDSRSVPGSLSFRESSVADARTTMDWLQSETGARRFILFGLCSGADNGLATAIADERVSGLVLLDPPAYSTRQARLRAIAARVARAGGGGVASRVVSVGRRLAGRLASRGGERPENSEGAPIVGGRPVPPPDEYRSQLAVLVDRRVAILSVFSGALGERYNHRDQLFELFPEFRGKIEAAYFPGANHTFTYLPAQASLISAVCAWVERLA